MKKFLICVLVFLILVLGAMCGYVWYQTTHIFVEDAVYAKDTQELDLRGTGVSMDHYLSVHSQLPDCEILWDVPFQGKTYSSDISELTISSLQEKDFSMLPYFENLKRIDATGCSEYTLLAKLREKFPKLEVVYQIPVGGRSFETDVTELTLAAEEFEYDVLLENLQYLPSVEKITLPKTDLSYEQIEGITAAYANIQVDYTITFMGKECDPGITELNLSDLTPDQVEEAARDLQMLRSLTAVELMDGQGKSNLSMEDVRTLQQAAPDAVFHYVFTLFNKTISTTDTSVTFTNNQKIRDEHEAQIRLALDIMENCEKFVLDNCRVSNKICAQIREDYRGKTKFVWRVFFGDGGSCLTDREVVRAVYGLTDDNCGPLQYCEDVRYMDIGHNEYLDAVPFVAYMPKLEAIIISGAPIKSLEPFAACESLVFLEASNCSFVTDISPLANCKNLKMLNLSFTEVSDLSPLDELELTHLTYIYNNVSDADEAAFDAKHPDCWTVWHGEQPYGKGWRYDENGEFAEYYKIIAAPNVFDYQGSPHNTVW